MATTMTMSAKPRPIQHAVILTAVNAIGGVLFTALMPDLDDRGTVLSVSITAGVLLLGAAGWLWTGSRWGAYLLVGLNALNILACLPAYFESDGQFMVGATASIVLGLLTIWFVWSAEAKAFWRRS